MKSALIVGVTLFSLLRGPLYSQGFDFFKNAQEAFALVPSISYRVHTYEKDNPKTSASMEWVEDKGRYRFLFQQFNQDHAETFQANVSYDGGSIMTSTDGGKTVFIEEEATRPLPGYIKAQQMLLAPYNFLLDSAGSRYWESPSLQRFQSREVWSSLEGRLKVMPDEELGGKRYKIIEVVGGTERFSGEPILYKIYLDSVTNYPHCVKTYDTSGKLLSELVVTRLRMLELSDSGKTMLCPEEITVKYFGSGEAVAGNEASNWQRFVFENLEVAPSPDVSLDLSAADIIYDVKNKTVIPIPR